MKHLFFLILLVPLTGCVSSQINAVGKLAEKLGKNTNSFSLTYDDGRGRKLTLSRNMPAPPAPPALALSSPFVMPPGTKFQIDQR